MAAPLVQLGATALCSHAGQGQPLAPNPRVLVAGQPVVTQISPYAIAGCVFPPVSGGPCVTAQAMTAALRVLVGGAPVLLQTSQFVCVPTGTPMTVPVAQTRVLGT